MEGHTNGAKSGLLRWIRMRSPCKERGFHQAREQAVQGSRLGTIRTKLRETKAAISPAEQECEAHTRENKNGYFY